jgi:hypothetical protein
MGWWAFFRRYLVPSIAIALGVMLAVIGYASEAYEIWTAGLKPWSVQLCGFLIFVIGVVSMLYQFHQTAERRAQPLIPASSPSPVPQLARTRQAATAREPDVELRPAVPSTEDSPPAPRVFLGAGITPQFLTDYVSGKTMVQIQAAVSPYIGKWMTVTGPVDEVSPAAHNSQHVILYRGFLSQLSLNFGPKWFDSLSTLHRGVEITVIGRLTEVNELIISLDDCELVET